MSAVTQLAYVGITVSDPDAWREYATEVLGVEINECPDGKSFSLRIDAHSRRFVLHPAKTDDLAYVGWEVANHAEFEDVIERLERMGTDVRRGTTDEAVERGVVELARFEDPEGLSVELCTAPMLSDMPVAYGRPMSGFKADALGSGHVFIDVSDVEKAASFYMDGLGFRVSDYAVTEEDPTNKAYFLHCNPRHHSLGLGSYNIGRRLGHWSMECLELDDVGLAYDRAIDRGVPITATLGRHSNDRMFSFYMSTPSGFEIEYGWGGLLVDDSNWTIGQRVETSVWGHRPPT